MINVFLCFDQILENEWRHVVNSIKANTKAKVKFYFIVDKSVSLKKIVEYQKNNIEVVVTKPPECKTSPVSTVKSKMQYVRFLLPDIFPDINKGIYLDNDVLFVGDIKDLWNIDLEDNIIGAVPDPLYDYAYKTFHFQGGRPKELMENFNDVKAFLSGQLIIDFKKYRENKIGKQLINNVLKYRISDMLAMNITLHNKIKPLSKNYSVPANFIEYYNDKLIMKGVHPGIEEKVYNSPEILHSHGKIKFWHKESFFHEEYLKYKNM